MDEKHPPDGGQPEPVFVPHHELAEQTLQALVESFILREGTDYGEREVTLEQKLAQVYRQLERGEARIVFDPHTESVAIVVAAPQTSRR